MRSAAWERRFTPLCNAFEQQPRSGALADVLWVFYVSKVRAASRAPSPLPTFFFFS